MSDHVLTQHALIRIAQRGIRADDLDLIALLATEVEDGYFMRAKDCRELERRLRSLADRVHRLMGKRVVVSGECIVTAYHAHVKTKQRLLRQAEERELAD